VPVPFHSGEHTLYRALIKKTAARMQYAKFEYRF
jgi:hypothetical protein